MIGPLILAVMLMMVGDQIITFYTLFIFSKHGVHSSSVERNPIMRFVIGNRKPYNLLIACMVPIMVILFAVYILRPEQYAYYIMLGMYIMLYIWGHIPNLLDAHEYRNTPRYWSTLNEHIGVKKDEV